MTAPNKTILVVDDDVSLVDGLCAVLRDLGYRAVASHDGAAGMASADAEKPDLVIVDMMMPKKSGFLVVQHVKTLLHPAPKVVMITANKGSRHKAYAESLGVDDYLRKPFGMGKLLEAVGRLCPLDPPV